MPTIAAILARKQPVHSIQSDATAYDAARMMVEHNVGALPVLEKNRLVGVFSERDLMRRVIAPGHKPAEVKVADVMTTDLVTAFIHDDDATCLKKMTDKGCRHLPVVDKGQLVGFLSARDVMKAQVEGMKLEIQTLTDYIYYTPPTGLRE
ncbi:MAG TPA: CBS domain-containing protein [candidate division Zixibacteria bacterium]|jgi:CBS domain-containing protein